MRSDDVKTNNDNFSVGVDSSEITFINPKSFENSTSFEEKWIYDNL